MKFTTAMFNVRPVAGLAVPCGFGKSGKAFLNLFRWGVNLFSAGVSAPAFPARKV